MGSSFPFEAAVYFVSSVGEHNQHHEEDEGPPGFSKSHSVWAPDGQDEEQPDVSPHGGETGDGEDTYIVNFLWLIANCVDREARDDQKIESSRSNNGRWS